MPYSQIPALYYSVLLFPTGKTSLTVILSAVKNLYRGENTRCPLRVTFDLTPRNPLVPPHKICDFAGAPGWARAGTPKRPKGTKSRRGRSPTPLLRRGASAPCRFSMIHSSKIYYSSGVPTKSQILWGAYRMRPRTPWLVAGRKPKLGVLTCFKCRQR